jgi:hypothetical protein
MVVVRGPSVHRTSTSTSTAMGVLALAVAAIPRPSIGASRTRLTLPLVETPTASPSSIRQPPTATTRSATSRAGTFSLSSLRSPTSATSGSDSRPHSHDHRPVAHQRLLIDSRRAEADVGGPREEEELEQGGGDDRGKWARQRRPARWIGGAPAVKDRRLGEEKEKMAWQGETHELGR